MPFESFETDEKLARPPKRGPDLDTLMLFGCSGFTVVALASWALVVWPHFLFTDTFELRTLERCGVLGNLPAAVFGAVVTRRFGLPAAAGFLGGTICSATFLYLRLQQVLAFQGIPDAPQPDFPASFGWLLPMGWLVFVMVIIAATLKPSEYALNKTPGQPSSPKPPDDRAQA